MIFTSSRLINLYNYFTKKTDKYSVKNAASDLSFRLLKFNFKKKEIAIEMRGKTISYNKNSHKFTLNLQLTLNNVLLQKYKK